jgi:hypothetical protein
MGCIVSCGLYEECQDINICFLGTDEALKETMDYLKEYPKATLRYFSTNGSEYEFATLKVLKKDCDEAKELFYGFYIHTKGCSYTEEKFKIAGKVWRDYLMDYIITKWRNNYKALNMKYMGYDLCSVKCVPARVSPSGRTHGSGNFFAFNSEYVRSLRKVETLNQKDRFESEMYIWQGQPIIYMPCNLFIDYLNQQTSYADFIKNYKELNEFIL